MLLRSAALSCRIVKSLDIHPPLFPINSLHATVICHQSVDLALHVGGLCPDTGAASEAADLVLQLAEQDVAAVVPDLDRGVDFVGSVDCVDCFLNVPETVLVSKYSSLG